MTNGPKTNEKQKSYAKRTSPSKDRTRKPKAPLLEKKTENVYNEPVLDKTPTTPLITTADEELLTPDTILKSYASVKSSPIKSNSACSLVFHKENMGQDAAKGNAVNILELLGKKDNLEKIAKSVTKAVEEQTTPIDVPQPSKQSCMKTPPCTPTKKCQGAERFAGLSNSPAPNNLPLPSFSFVDQELSNGAKDEPERQMFPYSTLPAPLLKAASAPSNLIPPSPYHPTQAVPSRDFGLPLTPQPMKPKHPRNRKLHSDEFPVVPTGSLPIMVQPPTRALNHSPPSNPHLDELSSQLRMMLHIVPTQS
jgi:hypothetical protein